MSYNAKKALRLIREYHDLNPTQIGILVGLHEKHVLALETGKRKITLEVVERYATAFEIPVSSLMLLAEQADGIFTVDPRDYVSNKVITILEWLAIVSAARRGNVRVTVPAVRIRSPWLLQSHSLKPAQAHERISSTKSRWITTE
jgi:transcriptional regulator with XRE-family HTH domain